MRVTQEVMNLTMYTPSNGFVLYDPPAHVDVWFELPPGSILPWPPLELRLMHYVYEPMTYDELQFNHSYSARYDDVGEFNITAEIFSGNYREVKTNKKLQSRHVMKDRRNDLLWSLGQYLDIWLTGSNHIWRLFKLCSD